MRLIVIFIAFVVLAFSGVVSCDRAPSEELDTSSPVVRIVETIGVDDSPELPTTSVVRVIETIGVEDLSLLINTSVVRVVETIGVADSLRLLNITVVRVIETIGVVDSPTLTPLQPPFQLTEVAVNVGSPKLGEVWRIGTYHNIGWTTKGEDMAYIGIYYSIDGGKSFLAITEKETNDGIYNWQVPNVPTKAALVRVIACNTNGETLATGDSGLFTIESTPQTITTITVTSPETGVVWVAGTTQNIKWTTTGEGIGYVGIYYSTDGGKSMNAISQKDLNDGVYIWNVPNIQSKTVLVRIIAYNNNGVMLGSGDSGLFSIILQ